jgi:hypothetical protein
MDTLCQIFLSVFLKSRSFSFESAFSFGYCIGQRGGYKTSIRGRFITDYIHLVRNSIYAESCAIEVILADLLLQMKLLNQLIKQYFMLDLRFSELWL